MSLSVAQRTVREINGIRPFQKATLDDLDSKAQIIVVEAPVGAGKSHIVRRAIDHWQVAVVLIYPTKILMDAQRSAIKSDSPDSITWPYETGIPKNNAPTVFYYSSDALVTFIKVTRFYGGINVHKAD